MKQYQINDAVRLDYRNADEWEFAIDHTVIEEQTANKYEALVMIEITVNEDDRQQKLEEFKSMKERAALLPAPYAFLKSWFLSEYGLEYHKRYEEQRPEENDNAALNDNQ